jgi:hypothetical protein
VPEPGFAPTRSQGLVDVLDRILDKGLVVVGDIRVNLANVELLTIHVRLIICSIDKAEQVGLTWWKHDPALTGHGDASRLEQHQLRDEVRRLRAEVERLTPQADEAGGRGGAAKKRR